MAILQAEPSHRQSVLVPRAMRILLESASPTNTTDSNWRPRVHSLNVLRMLYKDASLRFDVMPFVAEGLVVSVGGFSSPLWAIRNSSLLTYSQALSRAVGGANQRFNSGINSVGMTGAAFFNQFPSLHSFLIGELHAALEFKDGAMHPSLYPVLLLLSRLTPTLSDDANATHSLSAFVPLIVKCASHRHYMGRFMASRALVPLIPSRSLVDFTRNVIESLPVADSQSIQHNFIHGTLLQIDHLVQRISAESDLSCQLPSLIPLLSSRLWLATESMRCCPVRQAMLEVCAKFDNCDGLEEPPPVRSFRESVMEIVRAAACVNASTEIDFEGIGWRQL
eukprot:731033_1